MALGSGRSVVSPPSRAAYMLLNLGKNALAPLAERLGHEAPLGMEGELDAVERTLDDLAEGLLGLGFRAPGRDVLELGPGRTPQVALAFALVGAHRTVALDTSLHVPRGWDEPDVLAVLADMLAAPGGDRFRSAAGVTASSVRDRSAAFGEDRPPVAFIRYDGARIPLETASVDLIVSKSVLEHVRRPNVRTLVEEMERVLRPGGAMVHIVDLRDHMWIAGDHRVTGDWLDALRYPEWLFRAMFSNRSTSINRLRACQWRELFLSAGFEIVRWQEHRFPLPTGFSRGRLQPPWRLLDERELAIGRLEVAARLSR